MASLYKYKSKLLFLLDSQCYNETRRNLSLHEYHSKKLLKKYGVTIQDFRVVDSNSNASSLLNFEAKEYVIKAQIRAGDTSHGRFDNGLRGGDHLAKNVDESLRIAKNMIGSRIITKNTPKDGTLVEQVMIAKSVDINRETYLCFILDRDYNGAVLIASPKGGLDIDETLKNKPNLLIKVPLDLREGVSDIKAAEIAEFLQFKGPLKQKCVEEIKKLWTVFSKDLLQLEINPLVETVDGNVVAADAKIEIDDNARYRQAEIFDGDDRSGIEDRVKEAAALDLIYIEMDGYVGCMSNGAGVGMSTIDLVALHGGKPANFFDLGGKIGPSQVAGALKILETHANVKSVFINVFAGIVDCVTVASGIIDACKKTVPKYPVVVRLEGTNSVIAKEMLEKSGLPLHIINNADEAAEMAVKLAHKKR